jgi:hypothetical protein
LDYIGVPFLFVKFHHYENLEQEHEVPFQKKVWVKKGGGRMNSLFFNSKPKYLTIIEDGPIYQGNVESRGALEEAKVDAIDQSITRDLCNCEELPKEVTVFPVSLIKR